MQGGIGEISVQSDPTQYGPTFRRSILGAYTYQGRDMELTISNPDTYIITHTRDNVWSRKKIFLSDNMSSPGLYTLCLVDIFERKCDPQNDNKEK